MNLPLFPISVTNVFPMVNSSNGGQLATEFNMRSRESVATPSDIRYVVGPTYVHSDRDFVVSLQEGSSTRLVISEGRAVINGHYVQTLTPIEIDLPAAFAAAQTPMSGNLSIGIQMMYADTAISGATLTVNAYSGSLFAEDLQTQTYKGVQIVILPAEEFKIPSEVPEDESAVTAHLRLANFRYVNGAVRGAIENVAFAQQGGFIDANRINNLSGILSDQYVEIAKLRPNSIYVFAGKPIIKDGEVVTSGQDTWCDATDSIMVWDKDPASDTVETVNASTYGTTTEAKFVWNSATHRLDLVVPHKQIDGGMIIQTDQAHRYKYYPKVLSLPTADFNDLLSHGLVDGSYASAIQDAINQISTNLFLLSNVNHVQRAYIDVLNDVTQLPAIDASWKLYDYILVGQDNTQGVTADNQKLPATIYPVVWSLRVIDQSSQFASSPTTSHPDSGNSIAELTFDHPLTTSYITDIPAIVAHLVDLENNGAPAQGVPGDFITTHYTDVDAYWMILDQSDWKPHYADAIWISYPITLATEAIVGGFKNVSQSDIDQGYVIMDAQGHLRVLDYEKLASGALAYQLGEDAEYLNLTLEALQTELDGNVNNRVAFPNINQTYNALQSTLNDAYTDPSIINITIQLPDDSNASSTQVLTIHDIDSRFGGSVYLHITGSATSNTTVQINNCEKLRIDNHIGGSPNIILNNCNLFYDASVINYASAISGLSLWYELDHSQYDSTAQEEAAQQIYVDGMTVYQKNVPLVSQDVDAFINSSGNDLHYAIGLDSITLDQYGDVVGCGIRISDDITSNNSDVESFVVAQFNLPQGLALKYPHKRMTKKIKIAGEFMSAYPVTEPDCTHHLHSTTFTLSTTPYQASMDDAQMVPCTLSVRTQIARITPAVYVNESVVDPSGYVIPGLESGDSYVFDGRVTS